MPGQLLVDEMRRPVLHARVMILLVNPAYATSLNCGHELLATLRYRDRRKGHRTVVLLEEFQEKGYSPKWSQIRDKLLQCREAGMLDAVLESVDGGGGLLEWLDQHAVHASTSEDSKLTLEWFKCYKDGRSEALSSGVDFRLPWNFFIAHSGAAASAPPPRDDAVALDVANPLRAADAAQGHILRQRTSLLMPTFQNKTAAKKIARAEYLSRPWETLGAMFLPCLMPQRLYPKFGVDLTTGNGGFFIPANASRAPRRHVAPSYTIFWFVIAVYVIVAVGYFSYSITRLCPITPGPEGFVCAFTYFNATMVIAVVVMVLFVLFIIRWGAVLTTTASQLHSPELLVPLLAQKIHDRELSEASSHRSLKAFRTLFVVPNRQRHANSNCKLVADNLSAFLRAAGCDSDVVDFPPRGEGFFSDALAGQEKMDHLRSVYVLFLETKEDLGAWVDFNAQLSARPRAERDARDLTKRTVLVTSQRFLRVHSGVLFSWLCLEFAEVGREAALSPSGTPSDLGLAGAILGAVSMKLSDLLLEER